LCSAKQRYTHIRNEYRVNLLVKAIAIGKEERERERWNVAVVYLGNLDGVSKDCAALLHVLHLHDLGDEELRDVIEVLRESLDVRRPCRFVRLHAHEYYIYKRMK
jgi:hypothetical protein